MSTQSLPFFSRCQKQLIALLCPTPPPISIISIIVELVLALNMHNKFDTGHLAINNQCFKYIMDIPLTNIFISCLSLVSTFSKSMWCLFYSKVIMRYIIYISITGNHHVITFVFVTLFISVVCVFSKRKSTWCKYLVQVCCTDATNLHQMCASDLQQ